MTDSPTRIGHSYFLKNGNDGLFLSVHDHSASNETANTWKLDNKDAQAWYLMPVDDDFYIVLHKHSGLALSAAADDLGPFALPAQTHGFEGWDTQLWRLEKAGNRWRLAVKQNGRVLNPYGQPLHEPHDVVVLPVVDNLEDTQTWSFEDAGPFIGLENLPDLGTNVNDIPDVVRLTDFKVPPDHSQEKAVARALVPCVFVNDSGMDTRTRARQSPWYIMTRYGSWDLVYYYDHNGQEERTDTKEVTVGLTTANSKEITETTGIQVTAEAGFEFKGVSAKISTTYSHQLQVKTTHSEKIENTKKHTVSQKIFKDGVRRAYARWMRADRYVLTRADGSKVLEWRTRNEDIAVSDTWPHTF
ncbi:RICIN domain-containing protein [Streptomyces cinnamoneus]|uniref:RICIN domain-containing protein n=1 Tax=Streptomyces cinnamoneus TaxID=53446 RepID=UPI0034250D65